MEAVLGFLFTMIRRKILKKSFCAEQALAQSEKGRSAEAKQFGQV
jgi:hypothetical protein